MVEGARDVSGSARLRSVLGDCEAAQGAGRVDHDLGWSIPLMWVVGG